MTLEGHENNNYEMFQTTSACTDLDRSTVIVSKLIESLQDLRYCATTQNQVDSANGTTSNMEIEFSHIPKEYRREKNVSIPVVISANSTAASGFGDDNSNTIRIPVSTAFTPFDRTSGKARTRTDI